LLSSSVTAWTATSEKRYLHRILNRLAMDRNYLASVLAGSGLS
ncbi:hypothetical protein QU792_20160, partial [Escherichia coli]|nr:hypothetical protein [Escherichia coli]